MQHRIVAVGLYYSTDCPQCVKDLYPHSVIVRCLCGDYASGKNPHTWSITSLVDGLVSLSPSFDWTPVHPVHEYVTAIPIRELGELCG